MMWLRNAGGEPDGLRPGAAAPGVGVEDDIVRRETLATLVDVDTAFVEARRHCDALLDAAHQQAARIVEEADARAAGLVADAQQQYECGYQEGEQAGLRQAMADWHARSAQLFADERALLMKMRQRLAGLVTDALEHLTGTGDRAGLFAQAAAELDRLVEAGGGVMVRVHPDDLAVATREFDACAKRWLASGRPVTLSVMADRSLALGACLCESDLGTLDASLSTQLSAMRDAVERTMQGMPVQWPSAAPELPADDDCEALADDERTEATEPTEPLQPEPTEQWT